MEAALPGRLVKFAAMTRNPKCGPLHEGASTCLLCKPASVARGIFTRIACRSNTARALTDDPEMLAAVKKLSAWLF